MMLSRTLRPRRLAGNEGDDSMSQAARSWMRNEPAGDEPALRPRRRQPTTVVDHLGRETTTGMTACVRWLVEQAGIGEWVAN